MSHWGMRGAAALAMIIVALGAWAVEAAETPPDRVPSFELRDQFNDEHRVNFPRERPTVLALADRKGSEQLEGWLEPLGEAFDGAVHFDGVADVRGVPSLLRWGVRQIFRRGTKDPVMLDWEDTVCSALGFEKGVANVLVLDREGRIVHRVHGEAEADSLDQVRNAIEKLLTE